ncbi:methyltransferase domain-containing protein [Candidatus Woesearchaeota archaeon]|nr:methyltransferase domain-containing protein [Candidatus Woesearchaeota archaeon]
MKDKRRNLYDKRAKKYDALMSLVGYPQMLRYIIRTISLDLPENARILDLGCGTGLATAPLKKRFPKAEITGLDISKEMLKICIRMGNVKPVIGDFNDESSLRLFPGGRKFKLKSLYFDMAISTGALSEYGDPGIIIPLLHRVLKNKGIILNIGVNQNVLSRIVGYIWNYRNMAKEEFKGCCGKYGFINIKSIKIPLRFFPNNFWRYAVKAEKQ